MTKTLKLICTRFQKSDQSGQESVRNGVFWMPSEKAVKLYSKYYKNGKQGYGGEEKMVVEKEISLDKTIVVKAGSGGIAVKKAIDIVSGKGEYDKILNEARQCYCYGSKKQAFETENIQNLLYEYGFDEIDPCYVWINSRIGNQLAYALAEYICSKIIEKAGYDYVLAYNEKNGEKYYTELFDITEKYYPEV